ncbi:MAG: hypothetical protein ACTSQY_00435 [Candidatus Odinarchaeia archaeon]|nr:MAG: hypothetical protein [Lokiarchaeota virus Fenrir Meg22_1012]URC17268.1 MAG: hypothetical protein [Lokiarchaeota virus Fenrir Meg22_1214]
MPEITEEEMKKFKELIEKEKRWRKIEEAKKTFSIKELSKKVDLLLDLNKSYGPMEAYALTFANFLKNDFRKNKTNVLWFSWSEMQRYLTDVCLEFDKNGNKTLKKSFRERLKERGFRMKINRRWNTLEIRKTKPSKRYGSK